MPLKLIKIDGDTPEANHFSYPSHAGPVAVKGGLLREPQRPVESDESRSGCSGSPAICERGGRDIVTGELTFVEPFTGDRMARREYQKPDVKRQEGRQPYWYIRYRVRVQDAGKGGFRRIEKRHRLGDCDAMTKRQAERERDRIMFDVNNQVLTLREHTLFQEFVALYQRDIMPNLGVGTQAKYKSLFATHLLPVFGNLTLLAVDTQRIQEMLTQKKRAGSSWWLRSDLRNLLSGLYTVAIKWRYWTRPNPTTGTDIGVVEWKRDNRALTDDEVHSLISALDPNSQVRLIVETLVATGMRASEIFGLKWRYVDLNRGAILVRERNYRGDQGKPKSARSNRDLPLGSLVERYRALPKQPDGYVFHQYGEPLDERTVLRHQLRPMVEKLGFHFEGFGWHSFRRTHLTVLSEEGATAFETRDQAGHAKVETTMRYVKASLERRGTEAQRVANRLIPQSNAGILRQENANEAA